MLFPIGDDNSKRRSKPVVTYGLIAANIVIFLLELAGVFDPIESYGVIPTSFANGTLPLQNFLWAIFLHAGWTHIGFNMLFLYIFGDNVEDNLGRVKFLIFYLLCGVGGGLAHAILYPDSFEPMIGASGAIMGVMGAYLFLYPKNKIKVFAYGCLFTVRAWLMVGAYMAVEFFSGFSDLESYRAGQGNDDVAHFAHIGGFLTGIIVVLFLRRRGPNLAGTQIRMQGSGDDVTANT
jgi:membrane associated rhomboid family serine protease